MAKGRFNEQLHIVRHYKRSAVNRCPGTAQFEQGQRTSGASANCYLVMGSRLGGEIDKILLNIRIDKHFFDLLPHFEQIFGARHDL